VLFVAWNPWHLGYAARIKQLPCAYGEIEDRPLVYMPQLFTRRNPVCDHRFAKPVLSQLSYVPKFRKVLPFKILAAIHRLSLD
jgi:hypothetical protein